MKRNLLLARLLSFFALITFTFFAIATGDKKTSSSSSDSSTKDEQPAQKATTPVGQILHTEYFDIQVNKVSVKDRVNTGNEFSDIKPEAGNKFLIFNVTFKNTDKESRMIQEGSVWINYNGKDYEYDKSETILPEGYGVILEQINPLTFKTTNLVYKLPEEIKGVALWNPGRAEKDQVINLGEIK